ncbi:hypothetical protein M422DRAFT_269250 [Sphaerobolus stellatus SS14]|uniref:Unplaced genomic scaffold SPHSTscaffold_209, whole genome shotgun sequence n=1 Tax=Sphaerobolus stellatus (strain SS14) TaxID=990650 RepID=A0A0C9TIP8_SPHS4|nr:hypothetical protein M422DRAFT_269250 [Sphaerobolus stellatus SS14]
MTHQEAFPIQTRVRARLFWELSDEEQLEWPEEAKRFKIEAPTTIEDIIRVIPKLCALLGDAITKKIGWYMEIHAAGIGTDGKPHYFMERYKPIHDGKMLDYADIPEALVYDGALQNRVAGTHEVCCEDVYVVPPWKPQVFKSLPKVVGVRLVDMIDLDEQMQVQSGHEELKLAVQSYVEQTYTLVHIGRNRRVKVPKPNWDSIGEAEGDDLRKYIDPECLPAEPFEFRKPVTLKPHALHVLAQWIVDGEVGKMDATTHFRWQGQQDSVVLAAHKPPPKQLKPSKQGESASDGESGNETSSSMQIAVAIKKRKRTKKDDDEKLAKRTKNKDTIAGDKTDTLVVKPTGVGAAVQSKVLQADPPKSKPKASAKLKPKPKIKKVGLVKKASKTRKDDSEDSDAGQHVTFIHRGKVAVPHGGDYERWFVDFKQRAAELYWEARPVGGMDCNLVCAARFIEATVTRAHSTGLQIVEQSASVDITAPVNGKLADLVDAVLDPSQIFPASASYPNIKQWKEVAELLMARAECIIEAITNHPTDKWFSFISVGGTLAVFPALRCLEFVRRLLETRAMLDELRPRLDRLMDIYHLVLPQSQWQRWASSSFIQDLYPAGHNLTAAWHVYMECVLRKKLTPDTWWYNKWRGRWPALVKKIAEVAALRTREVEPWELAVQYVGKNWAVKVIKEEMCGWVQEMDETQFQRGCVVEIFLWTYTVFMMNGPGKAGKAEWCREACQQTCVWLLRMAVRLEAGIGAERAQVFKDGSALLAVMEDVAVKVPAPTEGLSVVAGVAVEEPGSVIVESQRSPAAATQEEHGSFIKSERRPNYGTMPLLNVDSQEGQESGTVDSEKPPKDTTKLLSNACENSDDDKAYERGETSSAAPTEEVILAVRRPKPASVRGNLEGAGQHEVMNAEDIEVEAPKPAAGGSRISPVGTGVAGWRTPISTERMPMPTGYFPLGGGLSSLQNACLYLQVSLGWQKPVSTERMRIPAGVGLPSTDRMPMPTGMAFPSLTLGSARETDRLYRISLLPTGVASWRTPVSIERMGIPAGIALPSLTLGSARETDRLYRISPVPTGVASWRTPVSIERMPIPIGMVFPLLALGSARQTDHLYRVSPAPTGVSG